MFAGSCFRSAQLKDSKHHCGSSVGYSCNQVPFPFVVTGCNWYYFGFHRYSPFSGGSTYGSLYSTPQNSCSRFLTSLVGFLPGRIWKCSAPDPSTWDKMFSNPFTLNYRGRNRQTRKWQWCRLSTILLFSRSDLLKTNVNDGGLLVTAEFFPVTMGSILPGFLAVVRFIL